jgi:hypothetical protein
MDVMHIDVRWQLEGRQSLCKVAKEVGMAQARIPGRVDACRRLGARRCGHAFRHPAERQLKPDARRASNIASWDVLWRRPGSSHFLTTTVAVEESVWWARVA